MANVVHEMYLLFNLLGPKSFPHIIQNRGIPVYYLPSIWPEINCPFKKKQSFHLSRGVKLVYVWVTSSKHSKFSQKLQLHFWVWCQKYAIFLYNIKSTLRTKLYHKMTILSKSCGLLGCLGSLHYLNHLCGRSSESKDLPTKAQVVSDYTSLLPALLSASGWLLTGFLQWKGLAQLWVTTLAAVMILLWVQPLFPLIFQLCWQC